MVEEYEKKRKKGIIEVETKEKEEKAHTIERLSVERATAKV